MGEGDLAQATQDLGSMPHVIVGLYLLMLLVFGIFFSVVCRTWAYGCTAACRGRFSNRRRPVTRSKLTSDFPPQPDDPRLLTAPQAAAALAISQRKLWGMTASGEIPHLRLGRCVRYPADRLQQLIDDRTKGGNS